MKSSKNNGGLEMMFLMKSLGLEIIIKKKRKLGKNKGNFKGKGQNKDKKSLKRKDKV